MNTKMKRLLGSLLLALMAGTATTQAALVCPQPVGSPPCPADANTTGVAIALAFKHANGNFIGPEGADVCETISVLATLSIPTALPGQVVETYACGTLTISGPGIVNQNVTPVGGIPLIGPATCGGVPVVSSLSVPYTITAADILLGKVTFSTSYSGGTTTSGTIIGADTAQDAKVAAPLTVNVNHPGAVCASPNNSGVLLTATAAGGIPPYTYVWTNLTTMTQVGTGPTFLAPNTTAGTTTYQVTARDALTPTACSVQNTTTVIVSTNPTVTVNNAVICQGATSGSLLTATVTGGSGSFTYSWNGPAGPAGTTQSIVPTLAGQYCVTVTDVQTTCTGAACGTLTINPRPTVTVNNATICSGVPATLTATVTGSSGPFTYAWSGPSGPAGTTASITVTLPGTYTVLVTDTVTTCFNTGSGLVTVNQLPTVVVPPISFCSGASGQLQAFATGTAPFTFSWTGPGGFTATGNPITVSAAGTYTVIVFDGNQCQQTTTGTVTVNPLPVVTVNSASACFDHTATLTATVTGGTAGFSYAWSGPNGFTSTANPITVSVAGNYTVTVTDANKCTGTSSGNVIINPAPVVTVNSPSVCQGGTATLTATVTVGTAPFTFAWSGPNGFTSSAQSITVGVAGSYVVIVTDHNGCVGSGTGTLTLNPPPSVRVPNVTICAGTTGTLTAVTGVGTTGTAPCQLTYSWTGPNGFHATGNPITIPNVTSSNSGVYTVTVTDCNGCTSTATGTLTVDSIICQVTGRCNCSIICANQTETLDVTQFGGVPPFTYVWKLGSSVIPGATGSSYTTGVGVGGTYSVTVTDSLGCTCTSSTIVKVDTIINCWAFCVGCQTPEVCNGSTVQLSAAATGGTAPFQYLWLPNMETTQTINVTKAGTYTLNVIDALGCSGTFSINVLTCDQCVTRDSTFWSSHIVTPPRTVLPTGVSCATLQGVFALMPGGLMNLGFLQVNLNQALGIFWGDPTGPGDASGRSGVCAARKRLSIELITAIANTTLLNPDSSGCGVQDPSTGAFILIGTLIQEAQAATQVETGTFDCANQSAWIQDMNALADLLNLFNAGGTSLTLPSNLLQCGIGSANSSYINTNKVDPTTGTNCGCPAQ